MKTKIDLSGTRIGMLTVLHPVITTPYSKKTYLCQCDCGNTCERNARTLSVAIRDGSMSSCGCYTREYLIAGDKERCREAGKHRKDANVNGSNIHMTLRQGVIQTNTSGRQGVSWSGTAHKWHVYVGYQNYRANLGFYEDMNCAIRVRDMAEAAIKDGTFEEFYYNVRGHHLGEKQKKQCKSS